MSRLGCASSWKMVACTGRSCVLSRGWTGHWNGICLRQWDIHGIFISWDICIRDHPSISIYRHYLYSSNRSISFRYHLFLYLSKCRSARWFTANQLKPRRGFRATVRQIGFMMELWFVRSSVSVELVFFWNGPESNILKLQRRKIWWHVMCRLHVFNVWECGNKMEEVWRSHALNQWTNKLYPIISHLIPHLYPCQSHLPNSIIVRLRRNWWQVFCIVECENGRGVPGKGKTSVKY